MQYWHRWKVLVCCVLMSLSGVLYSGPSRVQQASDAVTENSRGQILSVQERVDSALVDVRVLTPKGRIVNYVWSEQDGVMRKMTRRSPSKKRPKKIEGAMQ